LLRNVKSLREGSARSAVSWKTPGKSFMENWKTVLAPLLQLNDGFAHKLLRIEFISESITQALKLLKAIFKVGKSKWW
jgi:hypothetical protein